MSQNCAGQGSTNRPINEPVLNASNIIVVQIISQNEESILYKVRVSDANNNNFYVCKKVLVDPEEKDMRSRVKELEEKLKRARKLVHPHIIKFRFEISGVDSVYCIMDFHPLGSVQDRLNTIKKPLPLKCSRVWFAQILGAVEFIHSKDIAHRNIKLTKFLLVSEEYVVLSGFIHHVKAFRRELEIMRSTVFQRNITYQAPEAHAMCAQIWPYEAKAADMYSLGVCLFMMVNLDPPFDLALYERDQVAYINKKRNRDFTYHRQFVGYTNPKIKQLIWLLLEPKHGVRTTAKDAMIHEALLPE